MMSFQTQHSANVDADVEKVGNYAQVLVGLFKFPCGSLKEAGSTILL